MDYQNSSYYNQPTHSPYKGLGFVYASLLFGILALVSSCTGILPFFFGSLSILFAVLGHRRKKRMNGLSLGGIITSVMGILFGTLTLIYVFAVMPAVMPMLMQDEAYVEQMDTITNNLYGMDFSEMMEQYYGIESAE